MLIQVSLDTWFLHFQLEGTITKASLGWLTNLVRITYTHYSLFGDGRHKWLLAKLPHAHELGQRAIDAVYSIPHWVHDLVHISAALLLASTPIDPKRAVVLTFYSYLKKRQSFMMLGAASDVTRNFLNGKGKPGLLLQLEFSKVECTFWSVELWWIPNWITSSWWWRI